MEGSALEVAFYAFSDNEGFNADDRDLIDSMDEGELVDLTNEVDSTLVLRLPDNEPPSPTPELTEAYSLDQSIESVRNETLTPRQAEHLTNIEAHVASLRQTIDELWPEDPDEPKKRIVFNPGEGPAFTEVTDPTDLPDSRPPKVYHVRVNETWTKCYRVEAENEAEARNNLQAHFEKRGQLIGLGDEVSDLRRFFDVDDDEYWTVEEIPCK